MIGVQKKMMAVVVMLVFGVSEGWGLSEITVPYVPQVEVSADSKIVATDVGAGKEDVALFDLKSGKLIRTLQVATEADRAAELKQLEEQGPSYIRTQRWTGRLKFSGDGRYLASVVGGLDVSAVIFDMKNLDAKPVRIKKEERIKGGHGPWWRMYVFTADSRQLVADVRVQGDGSYGSDKTYLVAWDVATGKENWRVDVSTHTVKPMVFRSESDAVHVQSSDRWGKEMSQWFSTVTGKEIAEPPLPVVVAPQVIKQERLSDCVLETLEKVKEVRKTWVIEGKESGGKKVIAAVNNGLRVLDAVSGKVLFDLGDTTYHPPQSLFGP